MSKRPARQRNRGTFRKIYAVIALMLLAVPLVAMQFSEEVRWQASDFFVFAILLAGLGVVIELAIRFARTRWLRATAIALAIMGFVLVWAMLATG